MKLRRLHKRWTISTLLLVVVWLSVIIWLNVRPRIKETAIPYKGNNTYYKINYGFPSPYAYVWSHTPHSKHAGRRFLVPFLHESLAGNVAFGIVAVAVLTLTSKYVLNRIIAACRCGHVASE